MTLPFNNSDSIVMHIDLNSCFASCEQQANPLIRHKPVAVAAYVSPGGCILASSYEAKAFGVKTGTRVFEGRALCPTLIVKEPDPPLYRYISQKMMALFREYSPDCVQKSVDEAVLDFFGVSNAGATSYVARLVSGQKLHNVGYEIKERIKSEIGDYLIVNVGIGPNRFLAKTAASWHKPDGLDEINHLNLEEAFSQFKLRDLCGINFRLEERLNLVNVFTPLDSLHADLITLRGAFGGICGYYWYLRLRGYEIDKVNFPRRSFGQSYALPKATNDEIELSRLLLKLCEKMGRRLRESGLSAGGIHVACNFDESFFHHGEKVSTNLYSTQSLYKESRRILFSTKLLPVRLLAVSCFDLKPNFPAQQYLFDNLLEERHLSDALDKINDRYGEFVVAPASMMEMDKKIIDRIAFGK